MEMATAGGANRVTRPRPGPEACTPSRGVNGTAPRGPVDPEAGVWVVEGEVHPGALGAKGGLGRPRRRRSPRWWLLLRRETESRLSRRV